MGRVLVIDDEPDVLLLCRVNLRHAGHEVFEAGDGRSGVDAARRERPDAIVLDLMLPMVDGYAVLAELKAAEVTRDIPVLILTAKTQDEDRVRCWSSGASEYMTKPFSPEALSEAVAALIAMTPEERGERRELELRRLLDGPGS